jgi:DNA repair protein RadC
VLRPVIAAGAEAFIVVHQHPSGKSDPSDSDLHLTRQIAKACKPFGKSMTFVDHVVIGMDDYYSFEKHEPSLFAKRGEG